MEFKEGLYTYVKVIKDNDPKIKLEQFLLCTSCTTSYIFGKPDGYSVPEASGDSPTTLTPIEGGLPVPVTYVPTNLSMMGGENGDTEYGFVVDVARPPINVKDTQDEDCNNIIGQDDVAPPDGFLTQLLYADEGACNV